MSYETDRIEADINESRHRLNDTIEKLGDKISPGQILDEIMGLAQGQAGQFTANLGRQVRDNPLPAVLIGAGVLTLLMNKRSEPSQSFSNGHWDKLEEARWRTPRLANESDDAFSERLHGAYAAALDLKQDASEAIDGFKARVQQAVSSIERSAHRAGHSAGHVLSQAKNFAGDQVRHVGEGAANARHAAANFYDENPVVTGAIAIAIGAIVGAAAPLSSMEREALDDVAGSAVEAGAKVARKGADMVEKAASPVH